MTGDIQNSELRHPRGGMCRSYVKANELYSTPSVLYHHWTTCERAMISQKTVQNFPVMRLRSALTLANDSRQPATTHANLHAPRRRSSPDISPRRRCLATWTPGNKRCRYRGTLWQPPSPTSAHPVVEKFRRVIAKFQYSIKLVSSAMEGEHLTIELPLLSFLWRIVYTAFTLKKHSRSLWNLLQKHWFGCNVLQLLQNLGNDKTVCRSRGGSANSYNLFCLHEYTQNNHESDKPIPEKDIKRSPGRTAPTSAMRSSKRRLPATVQSPSSATRTLISHYSTLIVLHKAGTPNTAPCLVGGSLETVLFGNEREHKRGLPRLF